MTPDSSEMPDRPHCPQCGEAIQDGVDLDPLLIALCTCGHRYYVELFPITEQSSRARGDDGQFQASPKPRPARERKPRKRSPQPWRKKIGAA